MSIISTTQSQEIHLETQAVLYLAQLIERQYGIPIARRTVTKYRQLAGIDSSHRRRDFQVLI